MEIYDLKPLLAELVELDGKRGHLDGVLSIKQAEKAIAMLQAAERPLIVAGPLLTAALLDLERSGSGAGRPLTT